jgi:hypothetical protein
MTPPAFLARVRAGRHYALDNDRPRTIPAARSYPSNATAAGAVDIGGAAYIFL